jgi:hypothetical protein
VANLTAPLLNARAIRRGVFKNVRALCEAIQRFLDAWNDNRHPLQLGQDGARDSGQGETEGFQWARTLAQADSAPVHRVPTSAGRDSVA